MKLAVSAAIAATLAVPCLALAQSSTMSSMTSGVTSAFSPSSAPREPASWYDDRWYITPFGSYIWPDDARHSQSGFHGYGLALGKPINPYWNIELRATGETMDAESWGNNRPGYKFENWSVGLDAQWFFLGRAGYSRSESIQPYLVAGIGAITDKASSQNVYGNGSSTSFMANAGAGLVWPFASWGRLVLDGRYRYDANNSKFAMSSGSFGDWMVSVGLQIPLGATPGVAAPARAATPVPMPAPMPAPVVVAPPPPPPAPAPAPVPVTRNFDLSADGMFAFDRAELSDIGRGRIDKAMADLKQGGITDIRNVSIVGHTDPLGSVAYNQTLSEARANAVKNYLATQGVASGSISASGAGKSQPKITEADCKAQGKARTRASLIACLAPDRRVEVRFTGTEMRR